MEKPLSEELNLPFGNIFEPQEMLVLSGHISASFRKHGLLEIQKTRGLGFTKSRVPDQLLASMCISKEKTWVRAEVVPVLRQHLGYFQYSVGID